MQHTHWTYLIRILILLGALLNWYGIWLFDTASPFWHTLYEQVWVAFPYMVLMGLSWVPANKISRIAQTGVPVLMMLVAVFVIQDVTRTLEPEPPTPFYVGKITLSLVMGVTKGMFTFFSISLGYTVQCALVFVAVILVLWQYLSMRKAQIEAMENPEIIYQSK